VIRENANSALDELDDVLRVLRWTEPADEAQPRADLDRLDHLVGEARQAGQRVTVYAGQVADDCEWIRPPVRRTAFRVVQEGLTNARKHAPTADVTVTLAGRPGDELLVTIVNPLPAEPGASKIPGAGVGLTGLAERVELD